MKALTVSRTECEVDALNEAVGATKVLTICMQVQQSAASRNNEQEGVTEKLNVTSAFANGTNIIANAKPTLFIALRRGARGSSQSP